VLSPAFISSSWCKKEMDQAIVMSLNIRNENQVIPIMLEECEIPDQLTDLTYTDLNDYHDISNSMKLLKSAISGSRLTNLT
jgi:hypothetical protein